MAKFLLIVCFAVVLGSAMAQKECKEGMMARDIYYNVRECMSMMQETSTQQSNNNNMNDKEMCKSKCVHTSRGIFDEQGKPMKDQIKMAFKELKIEEEMRNNLVKRFENCLDENASNVKKDDCSTYKSFCSCVYPTFVEEICKRK